jgi:hypothetical protein
MEGRSPNRPRDRVDISHTPSTIGIHPKAVWKPPLHRPSSTPPPANTPNARQPGSGAKSGSFRCKWRGDLRIARGIASISPTLHPPSASTPRRFGNRLSLVPHQRRHPPIRQYANTPNVRKRGSGARSGSSRSKWRGDLRIARGDCVDISHTPSTIGIHPTAVWKPPLHPPPPARFPFDPLRGGPMNPGRRS